MPGHDPLAAQLLRPPQKPVKFQIPVAVDTGIGGQALLIAGDEFLNDLPVKIILKIKNVVPDAQPRGNRPGVLHIVQRAAGALLGGAVVEPHGDTGAVIAPLKHQVCRYGTVYAAAHANQRVFVFHG